MLNMVFSFMREQEVFVLAGMMLVGWILSQVLSMRRYRRLRRGVQSLAALQSPGAVQAEGGQAEERYESAGRSRANREELSQGEKRRRQVRESLKEELKRDGRAAAEERTGYGRTEREAPAATETMTQEDGVRPRSTAAQTAATETAAAETEVDSQLQYLKQSLDRIAAGRDQRLSEEPKKHRRLTAAEEQIILDILREYLD